MTTNLPQVKKKNWLSRLFSKAGSDENLPAVQARPVDVKTSEAMQKLRKLALAIHARTDNRFRTQRYVSAEAEDLDGGVYLYAFRNPLAGTWTINRYTYVPEMGFKCEPVKDQLCFWDALEYCGAFESSQKSYGKTPALEEDEEEAHIPLYTDMAEAEGIPLDLEGMPLLALDGEIVSPGLYDKKAVEVARRGAFSPPTPDTKQKQIIQIVRSAFNDVETEADDLQRVLKKSGVVKDFRLLAHFLLTAFNECSKIHDEGFGYGHFRDARNDLASGVKMLDEIAGHKHCPVDVKAQLKDMRIGAEFDAYLFFAKHLHRQIIVEQDSFYGDYLKDFHKKLEAFKTDLPDVDYDAVRAYIMDTDEEAELPLNLGRTALLFHEAHKALQENLVKDNRMSVQHLCRPK